MRVVKVQFSGIRGGRRRRAGGWDDAPVPIPEFIVRLRRQVGHEPLWLIGVTAVVLRERAGTTQVLLVRRADTGAWTPVTGIVDPGEDPHVTAVRETVEEAQVVTRVERLVWVAVTDRITYANGDVTQYLDHTYACTWVSGEPAVGDEENTEAGFFDVADLPELSGWHRERVERVLSGTAEVRLGR